MRWRLLGAALLCVTAWSGCESRNLSEEEARRLVNALPDHADGVRCAVQVIRPDMLSEGQTHSDYFLYMACSSEAASAGLATAGACEQVATGISLTSIHYERGCRAEWPGARLDGETLWVPCAAVHLRSVRGISTDGNTATFTSESELTLNPELTYMVQYNCGIHHPPEPGVFTHERTARRDDSGAWSLVSP